MRGMERDAVRYADHSEDNEVSWARRRESVRGALKLFRSLLAAERRHGEWVETRHGISSVHLRAVWELSQIPGMRAVDLAKSMAMHRSAVETLLGDLRTRELVLAKQDADAQAPSYFLTREGKRMADASPDIAQGVLKSALEHLSDNNLQQLVDALKAVSEHTSFREERIALQPVAAVSRGFEGERTPVAGSGHALSAQFRASIPEAFTKNS